MSGSRIELDGGRAELDVELDAYERERGVAAAWTLNRSLVYVIRWLRREGHGKCELHAVDHVLGKKLKIESYKPVR